MKKVMAIVIAALMVFSLIACGTAAAPSAEPSIASTSTEPSAAASAAPESEEPKGAVDIGFFDPSIDYNKAERYKIAYMYSGVSSLYDMFVTAFQAWADRMNVEFTSFSTTDADVFLETAQTYADQGYAGFLLDPDPTIYPAVVALMNESRKPWMSCVSPAVDTQTGKLMHPSVGFNNVEFGSDMFQWCIDYAKVNWKDATPENTGGIFLGYSAIPLLELRHSGAKGAFLAAGYKEENFFFGDGVTGDQTSQTGYNISSDFMSANPRIKYWIGCGFFDDYTDGIARAAEDAGKAETTICSTAGGSVLVDHWDKGETSSWKSAVFIEQRLYGEPIFCGLYAMITGEATAVTLWPQWVDKGTGETYASLLLPATTITQEMYQEYLAFVDQYTGIEQWPYADTDKVFPVITEPPASLAG